MKKKLLYSISIALATGLGFASCSDILDTEDLSTDDQSYVFSNNTDTRKMLNHVYAYFCEDSYTSRMSTNWMQNTDVEIGWVNAANAQESTRRGIWALNPTFFTDIQTCWDNSLKAIDFANICIEGIEGSALYKSGDAQMKHNLGEAYALRAYWYWLMCNFWADVPFATTPSSKEEMHNDPRTDKNIIYTRIIQDLIDHEAGMKWSNETTVEWMNRDFVLGFIAKLAMFRAGYSMQKDGTMARCSETGEEYTVKYVDENGNEATASSADDYYKVAIAYAKKLIAENPHKLNSDYKAIFDAEINGMSEAGSDVLFEMGYVPNSGGDIGWCHGLSVVESTKGAGTTYTNITPYIACAFDSTDQRLPVTCANYHWLYDNKQCADNGYGVQPAKWCRMDLSVTNVASKGTGINFPILRYSDVLLLLAEALNETNNTEEAKTYLKQVRERAFIKSSKKSEMVDNYVNNLSSKDAFKQAIILERALELAGENIRRFDLIRWNYYTEAITNTLEWIKKATMNYQRVKVVDGEFVYDKELEIEDMGVAPRLYYKYENGAVKFENSYSMYCDASETPYKDAETLSNDDIKNPGMSFDGLKRIDFINSFMSVSDTDPNTKVKYGTDENGNTIKKGIMDEKFINSFYGLTNGIIVTGTENITEVLKGKVTPYVIPIPETRVSSSNGILSNDGYGLK